MPRGLKNPCFHCSLGLNQTRRQLPAVQESLGGNKMDPDGSQTGMLLVANLTGWQAVRPNNQRQILLLLVGGKDTRAQWPIGCSVLVGRGGWVGWQGQLLWWLQPCTNPGTRVEPQQIVAQRLLSCVQYPVLVKSSTEDLTRPTFCFAVKYCVDPKAIGTPTQVEGTSSLPAWILS